MANTLSDTQKLMEVFEDFKAINYLKEEVIFDEWKKAVINHGDISSMVTNNCWVKEENAGKLIAFVRHNLNTSLNDLKKHVEKDGLSFKTTILVVDFLMANPESDQTSVISKTEFEEHLKKGIAYLERVKKDLDEQTKITQILETLLR